MHINYTKLINITAILYALVLPLSRAGISLFTIVLVLLWIFEGNFSYKWSVIKNNRVIIALFTFIGFNFVSLLWTNEPTGSLEYIRRYWYLLPMLVLLTSLKKTYIPQVLSAFISGMLISEILAYGVFFELWPFKHATVENPAPFMHHIEYSIFLAFSALVLLSRIFHSVGLKSKIFYAFFFMTMSGNLFLTAGRTGQIAFILGLFVLALVSFRNKLRALVTAIILSTTLLVVAFNFSDTFHQRVLLAKEDIQSVLNQEDYCSSWGSRMGAYITAKDIIIEHPLLGAGIIDNMRDFRVLVKEKYPQMGCIIELPHMHNQYLQIFTQLGIIGLLIFLYIFYSIAHVNIKEGEFDQIKYIYLTVLLFALIAEVLLHRAFSLSLFTLIVGLLLAYERVQDEI